MIVSPAMLTRLLLLALPLLALLSLGSGVIALQWSELWQADSATMMVLLELRLPRLLLTLLGGALLGLTGAVVQALFRNPLADPSLIGVSAGAGLAAVALLVMGGSLLGGFVGLLLLPLAAFGGGLLTTLLVARIARTGTGLSVTTMLLAGIAINSLAAAIINLFQYLADDLSLRQSLYWLLGGFQQGGWAEVVVMLPVAVLVIGALLRYGQRLNLMLLGDREAVALGVPVHQLRRRLVILAALGVAVVVSLAGMIGFVGLVVPHWVRLLCGPDHRHLLPLSALLGALFLTLADLMSRTLLSPSELPIGIVTAMVGGPFFLSMILYRRRF
ncbi:FecCD family ABC transporter permease [Marinobacterium arenosum]|uniref:FecCD family ABC transporter permease n=1 Tax=Marinobacterium arenosum TaxID=2862496 RepID=UPI002104E5C2|nr:iron ABC transporter permease [Marinobacterium arenosum]